MAKILAASSVRAGSRTYWWTALARLCGGGESKVDMVSGGVAGLSGRGDERKKRCLGDEEQLKKTELGLGYVNNRDHVLRSAARY